jgi:prevent-host-death family protein
MIKTGIKEARQGLPAILSRVQDGEEVIITKRGEPVAKITSIKKQRRGMLKSHKALREALSGKGRPLSKVVCDLREKERS